MISAIGQAEMQTLIDSLPSCDVLKCATRDDWLAARPKLGVGASQTAALFGCGFDSQYRLWAKVTDPTTFAEIVKDEAKRMFWGRRMEPVIIDQYAEDSGLSGTAWPQNDICVAKHFRGFCTPDAVFYDELGPILVEVKAYDWHARKDWTAGPPAYIVIQCQHQMEVTGVHRARVVVLFGNDLTNLGVYDIEYDAEFGAVIRARVERFNGYVDNRLEPPIDESEETADAIAKRYPDADGTEVDLPDDSDAWAQERATILKRMGVDKKRLGWLDNNIKAKIGAATFGATPSGRYFKWAQQSRAGVDVDKLKSEFPEAYEACATESKFRVLRPSKGPV
jgi:predicted phage-related endonuclease